MQMRVDAPQQYRLGSSGYGEGVNNSYGYTPRAQTNDTSTSMPNVMGYADFEQSNGSRVSGIANQLILLN